jgi:predicted kinase
MQTIGGLRRPTLIAIGGHAGSGKTTLAHALAAELGLPVLSKDAIKDLLFTQLGTGDPAWSQRLGAAAIALLFQQLEPLLALRQSCSIESIFRAATDGPLLRGLCARYRILPVELHCVAAGPLLAERVLARAAAGVRHPGHADETSTSVLARLRDAAPLPLLDLGGPALTIDTGSATAPSPTTIAAWMWAAVPEDGL